MKVRCEAASEDSGSPKWSEIQALAHAARDVKSRSGASDDAVQPFFAYGQLCHLITTISLDGNTAAWARMLTTGMRHPR